MNDAAIFTTDYALAMAVILRRLILGESSETRLTLPEWQDLAEEESRKEPGSIVKLIDDQSRICYASESHKEILGYLPGQIIGSDIRALIAPQDLEHSDLSIQDAVLTTYSVDISFGHRTAEGGYVPMRRKAWGLRGDEKSSYYVMTRSTRIAR